MIFDSNDFFRQITSIICSTLNMGKAMSECCRYLQKYIPADELFLNYYDPALDLIRTVARATSHDYAKQETIIKLPEDFDAPTYITQWPRTQICNRPEKDRLNHIMMRAYGMKDYSIMQMFLETREQKFGLGHLSVIARGKDVYTQEHMKVFSLLKEPFSIASSNMIQHSRVLLLQKKLKDDNLFLQSELLRLTGDTIIGAGQGLRQVMKNVNLVAPKMSSVLLTGETGVGKDVIANTLHHFSPRKAQPFIKVNCGAIPETLIDSELFGHEKGAFTGAESKRRGRFERAHNGTIFLDEIGELPLAAQVRLLRVLQNGEIEPLGSSVVKKVDTRVIAATNRDLLALVREGRFRKDLFYRLNVFPIHIPPLRERKQDISILTLHLIEKKCRELLLPVIPKVAESDMEHLLQYDWPGNIRELENVVERALILCETDELSMASLILSGSGEQPKQPREPLPISDKLDHVTSWHINRILKRTGGRIHGPDGAAKILDINPGTLRNRMKKLGIPFGRKRT